MGRGEQRGEHPGLKRLLRAHDEGGGLGVSGSGSAFEAVVDGAAETGVRDGGDGDAGEGVDLGFAVEPAKAFEEAGGGFGEVVGGAELEGQGGGRVGAEG